MKGGGAAARLLAAAVASSVAEENDAVVKSGSGAALPMCSFRSRRGRRPFHTISGSGSGAEGALRLPRWLCSARAGARTIGAIPEELACELA